MSEPIKLPPLPALVSAMITDYATLAVKQNTAELLKELTTLQRWYADVSMRAEKAEAEIERLRAVTGKALEALEDARRHNYALIHKDTDALVEALRTALKETK